MGAPPAHLEAGHTSFQPCILVTSSNPGQCSNLVAVASLVTPSSTTGALTALPSGYLLGPKLFDNIHPLPAEYSAKLPRDLRDSALGYVSFSSLCIHKPGTYRVRFTLLKLADTTASTQDAVAISSVDSDYVRVRSNDRD